MGPRQHRPILRRSLPNHPLRPVRQKRIRRFYSYAWTNDPIVYGFIPESGTASNREQPGAANCSSTWYAASRALNCGGEEVGGKTVECVRGKSWRDVLAAVKSVGGTNPMGAFGPKADGKTVFADYAARRAAGNFIRAPILVGATDDEGGLSVITGRGGASAPKGPPPSVSSSSPPGVVPPPAAKAPPASLWSVVINSMGPAKAGGAGIGRRQTAVPKAPDLSGIGCGPHSAALGRVKNGVPAWRYVYNGVWPNRDIESEGAWHGADIGLQFGTTEFLSKKPDTDEEKKMVKTIMRAWSAFAKDPKEGLKKLGWPIYDENKPTVISLGGRNHASVEFVDRKAYDDNCPA